MVACVGYKEIRYYGGGTRCRGGSNNLFFLFFLCFFYSFNKIHIANIINNTLYWSDEIYRIFDLPPQEFGATYEAFLNFVHPDDREFLQRSVDEALHEKKPYAIDHRIVLPDGKIRIAHEHAEVVWDQSGRALRMTGTVQDVTEHKEAEDELKILSAAIEHSVNVIFITDVNGVIE